MVLNKSFRIRNRLGIHARVAARLVETASRFKAKIFLEFNGQEVDGRSILGILTLCCPMGSHLSVQAEGPDAEEAMAAMEALFADKFGEE
jgi:phosphocarrier protein